MKLGARSISNMAENAPIRLTIPQKMINSGQNTRTAI